METLDTEELEFVGRMDPRRGRTVRRRGTVDRGKTSRGGSVVVGARMVQEPERTV